MLTLATTLLLIYLLHRHRKKNAQIKDSTNTNENRAIENGKAELDGTSPAAARTELDGTTGVKTAAEEKRVMHELNSPMTVHEINSENHGVPQELQGSSVPVPQELEGGVKGGKEGT